MAYKKGRATGWTSGEVKRIYQELRRGNFDYKKDAILCTDRKCRAGMVVDVMTGEEETCETCDGWGILRII
jgi:hypothetical protein